MKHIDTIGKDRVYLTGSRRTIERVICKNAGKFFIAWYGNMIEVKKGNSGYYTVEAY